MHTPNSFTNVCGYQETVSCKLLRSYSLTYRKLFVRYVKTSAYILLLSIYISTVFK